MKALKIKEHEVLFDNEDYEWVSKIELSVHESNGNFYIRKKFGRSLLHRLIMNAPKGMVVDHINHNTLDNRKVNLRVCTRAQNSQNRLPKNGGTYKYKGVFHRYLKNRPPRYSAYITNNKRTLYLGYFNTIEEAALAYDKKALELHGKYAYLNFNG